MPLYVPETATFGSPQAMLPRVDENSMIPVSLADLNTAIANAVSIATQGSNFRINSTNNQLQFLNVTNGGYSGIDLVGNPGSESIEVLPQS